MSYNLALDWLKHWCTNAGIDKDVGFHLLRRGAATHMHSLDIELISIQHAGDWSSLCVLKYLTIDFAKKLEVERLCFVVSLVFWFFLYGFLLGLGLDLPKLC